MDSIQRIPSSQPECSMEARLLAERLAKVPVSEIILYTILCQLVNLDVQGKRRDLLDTARKLVQNEFGMVFEAVTGKGLKRLDNVGIVAVGESIRQRTARAAQRTMGKLACVNVDALAPVDQHRLWAYQGIFGAVAVLTHQKTLTQARSMEHPQQLAVDGISVSHLFVAQQSQHQQVVAL